MKNFFRKIVLWILKKLAIRRLKSYRGKIIGITGSIGKTSTKEAVFHVLNSKFKVKRSQKSMNTEFGLLLTILDIDESGYRSAPKWAWLLLRAFFHSLYKDTSDVLLLEMGVDKPGDMDYLTGIVKPDIVVFTNVAPVHLDDGQFKSVKEIFEEKSKILSALKPGGIAVLNIDNQFIDGLPKKCKKKKVVTYGKNSSANFKADEISYDVSGLKFRILHGKKHYEVRVPVLGEQHVYVVLPAIVCGSLWGISVKDSIAVLGNFSLPPGRMSLIPAVENCTILDSSYNSSPEALKEALQVLKHLGKDRRKVAVLGNMNELGKDSKLLHENIGSIVSVYADVLITVGSNAAFIAKKAVEFGFNEKNVSSFKSASEAISFFRKVIKENDLVLVKGSQNNVRLEKFVKEFMANPEDAKNLLARQEKFWLNSL